MNDDSVRIVTELDKICRTCLSIKNSEDLRSLFENALDTLLLQLTDISTSRNDGLPGMMCTDCILTLNMASNFKDQCLKSEAHLRNALLPPQIVGEYKTFTILSDASTSASVKIISSPIIIPAENQLYQSTKVENLVSEGKIYQEEIYHFKKADVPIFTTEDISESHHDIDDNPVQVIADNKLSVITSVEAQKMASSIPPLPIHHIPDAQEPHISVPTTPDSPIKFLTQTKYSCDQCGMTFKFETSLKMHTVKHGMKIRCELCDKEFKSVKFFRTHMKTHSDYKPYSCEVCQKTFALLSSLTKHMRVHGGEKKHLCTVCGKRFFEPGYLNIHMRVHTGEKPIVCSICGKAFADPHGLIAHNKVHTREKKYRCDVCGKHFGHSFVLRAHRRIHTGEKPYSCSTCGAAFATSSYLTIHIRTHTQDKPYKCQSCPKAFVSKSALLAHTRTHTGEKKFQCAACGKRTARAADLQIHMRSHTGEKPYACDQCSKRYNTSSNLSVHKRSHLGIKNHVCSICFKAFGDVRTLNCHIRTHTGEKPYVCKICGNRYSQSGQLAAHKKTHASLITAQDELN